MAADGLRQGLRSRAALGSVAQAQRLGLSHPHSSPSAREREIRNEEERVRYHKRAMIVAPQPEPTEAGADVLREGGNAVDAGIACALVQTVVDPQMCGIAGF